MKLGDPFGPGFEAEVFDRAQSCRDASEYRAWLLDRLRQGLDCEGALVRPGARWSGAHPQYLDTSPRFADTFVRAPAPEYRRELEQWCAFSRGNRAFIDGQLYDGRAQSRMAVYSDLVRPHRVRSILACPLSFRGEVLALMFFFRGGTECAFEQSDADALTRLIPLLALAERAVQATFAAASPTLPPDAARELLAFRNALDALGRREREVTELIAQGLQAKEIAQVLGSSHHTVRAQTQRIFEKLGVNGRTKLAVLFKEVVERAHGGPTQNRGELQPPARATLAHEPLAHATPAQVAPARRRG